MKVLFFGASGFVGSSVTQSLSRAGHTVYGVTRFETKAKKLATNEIFPVVGEPTDPHVWAHLIPTIDVVIEAMGGTADIRTTGLILLDAVAIAAQSTRPAGSPKVTFIYTSGTWVHGSSTDEFVSDTTPLVNPLEVVAWTPRVEQTVLKDDRVNGIVIRHSLLYGKSSFLFSSVFEAAETGGQVAWYGRPGGRLSLIHVEDLADVYVRAAERSSIVGGLAIDACNEGVESVDDFLRKLVQISGAKGPHGWIEPTNPIEEALATTVLVRPHFAKILLGWQQRKPGLTDGLPMYYAAWKASRSERPNEKYFLASL